MKTGDIYIEEVAYSQDQVIKFAEISGDKNPVHLDSDYAANTIFKSPIIHGFLSGSIFSKIIGTKFPGEGSIYLKQELKFLKPMYVSIIYAVKIEVTNIRIEKKHISLKTSIIEKNSGILVLEGEALVYFPNL